ncbi:MAG TPA: hypothetical protein VIH99_00330 [Bdellovibrionota bacterium]|jgi:hypothetical protein
MKFKKGWEEVAKEPMPEKLRSDILRKTRLAMDNEGAKGSPFSRIFQPFWAGALVAAAAVAVIFFVQERNGPKAQDAAFLDDFEMLRDAEMLRDLPTLRKLVAAQKLEKKKWLRTKS